MKTKRIGPGFGPSKIAVLLIAALAAGTYITIPNSSRAGAGSPGFEPNRVAVPNIDPTLTTAGLRKPTGLQLSALDQFKGSYGSQTTVRWNPFSGTPDVMMGFHTSPSSDTPENTARAFVANNQSLFGVEPASLKLSDQKEAFGGYLVKFQQKIGDLDLAGGGLGFLMNSDKQIRMVMGPAFRDVTVSATPALDGASATARALADLVQYQVSRPGNADQLLTPALDRLAREAAPALHEPTLNVFPTANGYRLAWNVITFSRNPFGVFVTQVDATNGQILAREDKVSYQNPQDALSY